MRNILVPLALIPLLMFAFPSIRAQTTTQFGGDNPSGVSAPGGADSGFNFNPYTGGASRTVTDLKIDGAVSAYGLTFSRTFSTRKDTAKESSAPATFFGAYWRHSFQWDVVPEYGVLGTSTVNDNYPNAFKVYFPDGRIARFPVKQNANNPPAAGPSELSLSPRNGIKERFIAEGPLVNSSTTSNLTTRFHIILADGGRVNGQIEMGPSKQDPNTGRLGLPVSSPNSSYDVVVDSIQDPNGLTTNLTYTDLSYGSNYAVLQYHRLAQITDPTGRYISLQYPGAIVALNSQTWTHPSSITGGSATGSPGRKISFGYGAPQTAGTGPLTDVTYDEGANAHYSYDTQNNVIKLNDPRADAPRSLQLNFYPSGTSQPAGALHTAAYFDPATNATTTIGTYTYTSGPPLMVNETRGDGPVRSWTFGTRTDTGTGTTPKKWQVAASTDWEGKATIFGYDSNSFLNSVKDPELHTTTFTNETVAGQVTQITFNVTTDPRTPTPPAGPTPVPTVTPTPTAAYKTIVYDDFANPYWVQSVTDELKHPTIYERGPTGPNGGANHVVTKIKYPDGSFESYDTFNQFNQPLHHTKRNGTTETFVFDNDPTSRTVGLLQSVSDPLVQTTSQPTVNLITTFGYNPTDAKQDGRVWTVKDPRQHTTTLEYNLHGQVTKVTYQDNSFIQKHYDAYGRKDWEKDELTHHSSFLYDAYDRVTNAINPTRFPRSSIQPTLETKYTYARVDVRYPTVSSKELAHTTAKPRQITSTGGKLTLFDYDGNFRLRARTDGYSTTDAATTKWTYDDAGNIETSTTPATGTATAAGVLTTNGYDARNRLITSTTAGRTTTIFYDAAGNVTKRYSPDGYYVEFDRYDEMNQLEHAFDENRTPLTMDYYPSGKLKTVTDVNSKVYAYDYDSLDQRIRLTYPDTSYEEWLSRPDGLPKSARNRAGDVQSFDTYDLRDRLTAYSWSGGTAPSVTIGYDLAGRVETLANASSTITRTYWDDDVLQSETQAIAGAPSRQIFYTPDDEGLPHRIKYPMGAYLQQNFDNLNRLNFVGQDDGTDANLLLTFASYAYNDDSSRQNIVRGNGVQTDYGYETLPAGVTGRIKTLKHYVPAAGTQAARTISSRTYGYDQVDRMLWFQKSISTGTNPLENGRGDSYGYDEAGQLTSAAYEVTNPAATNNVADDSWVYGPAGNRSSMDGVAYTFNTSGLNQYASAPGYGTISYGGRGNVSALGGMTLGYDALNELTSASTPGTPGNSVSLSYDAAGRCVKRVVNGTVSYFYYDGWNLIEEDDATGVMQRLYVHGPGTDELAAMWNAPTNSWAWYYYDARGSVTHLTNASGQLIEQYSYGAFGFPTYYNGSGTQIAASAWGNRFLFQGRDWINVLGLYDFRNRMYHPGIGRFLQPDPLGLDAGDPNIYRFCNNDPINGSDPTGLFDEGNTIYPSYPSPSVPNGSFWDFSSGFSGSYSISYGSFMDSIFSGSSSTSWSFTSSSYGPGTSGYGLQQLFALRSIGGSPGGGALNYAAHNRAELQVVADAYSAYHNWAESNRVSEQIHYPRFAKFMDYVEEGSKYYSGTGRIAEFSSSWGVNRLVKALHNEGFVLRGPTVRTAGLLYRNPATGAEMRIMQRPSRAPFHNEPLEKFLGDHYYRYRHGPDQPWGPHTPIGL